MTTFKNLAAALVSTPPSPATSGTSLTVPSGHGARFDASGTATIGPADELHTSANAEIVTFTRSTDTLTIVRARESSTARTVIAGDIICQAATAAMLTAIAKYRYVVSGVSVSYNPTDATTYYFGPFASAPGGTEGLRSGYFHTAGTIRQVQLYGVNTVPASGGENSTITLRINQATPTGGVLTTAFEHDQISIKVVYSGLTIPVAAGDQYDLKIDHPTYSVNPTGVLYSWSIEVEVST